MVLFEMDQQKQLLSSLLVNSLDRATLIYNLSNLKVDFEEEEPFVILKYKLQLRVLENISKSLDLDEQNVYYETLMEETNKYLQFHCQKYDRSTFQCTLVGCLFKCKWHRNYVRHIQRSHSKATRIVCQFARKCSQTFTSIDLLVHHIENVRRELLPMFKCQQFQLINLANAFFENA